jgi:hypothetical protein
MKKRGMMDKEFEKWYEEYFLSLEEEFLLKNQEREND